MSEVNKLIYRILKILRDSMMKKAARLAKGIVDTIK